MNSSELFLNNKTALDNLGQSITTGATPDSVQHARENVRHAKRLLAIIEIENAERRKAEKRRATAHAKAWAAEALP